MINLFELVLMGILGLLFLVLGLRIWKREEITFIHSYHYKKVAEKDKNQYTEEMCKSIVLMGIWMVIFYCFFILGIMKMFRAQIKYNKGIF